MKRESTLWLAFSLIIMVSCVNGGTPKELQPNTHDVADTTLSDVLEVQVDPEAPSAPSDLAAEPHSTTSVKLTWMGSTDNIGVTGYKVFDQGEEIGSVATLTFNHNGLALDSTHCYRVKAFDLAGNVSEPSDEVCITLGTCATGYHNGGDGTCVTLGTCSTGYHDGGDGTCVTLGTCSTDYHDGGNGTCVSVGTCSTGYHDGGDGTCVTLGTCSTNYHDGGDGTCVSSICTPTFTGCQIGTECIDNGTVNTGNPCQVCDTSRSKSEWSANNGVVCVDEVFCNGSDTCSGGSCSIHSGDPCIAISGTCNEEENRCDSVTTGTLVINEVKIQGFPKAYDEFIELYNGTGSAIDLEDYCLYYLPSSPGLSDPLDEAVKIVTFPTGASIAANGYVTWGNTRNGNGAYGSVISNANHYPTDTDVFSTSGGGIALYTKDVGVVGSTRVDSVAWDMAADTHPFLEGGAGKQAPYPDDLGSNNAQSLSRCPNGQDTDNNKDNFKLTNVNTFNGANSSCP